MGDADNVHFDTGGNTGDIRVHVHWNTWRGVQCHCGPHDVDIILGCAFRKSRAAFARSTSTRSVWLLERRSVRETLESDQTDFQKDVPKDQSISWIHHSLPRRRRSCDSCASIISKYLSR
jgi:hypothetical protein